MYKCNDCGCKFEEPSSYTECVGECWGVPAYETFSECPECSSGDFGEVEEGDEDD